MHVKTRNKDEVAFIINDALIQDISTHFRNNKKIVVSEGILRYLKRISENSNFEAHVSVNTVQKSPYRAREWMKGAHIQFPGWPNDTLEFGWWDTRDGTALQEVSTLRAGKVCIVHQGCFGDTTVNAHAGHILVPVARGTSEENPFLETESFLLSTSHRLTINQICFLALEESQWLFVRPFCLCPFLWLTAWGGGADGESLFVPGSHWGSVLPSNVFGLPFPRSDLSIFTLSNLP